MRSLTASVGYRTTDSTIDYYDVSTPTFGVQFSSFNFLRMLILAEALRVKSGLQRLLSNLISVDESTKHS